MAEVKSGLIQLGPLTKADVHQLLLLVQQEIEAMVTGETFHEDPERLEILAGLQTMMLETPGVTS